MKTFLHFWMNEDEYPMRLANLPFALIILTILLAMAFLFFYALGWLFGIEAANGDSIPATLRIAIGVAFYGFAEGVMKLLGAFCLALRAPKDLNND